ncbi:hypothetical protein [Erythrobacter neustonensis]|uniref:Uncharacterized protein n=1 Tax=Erythrobacter neustonensis TaxID=1112 RepID=A0A192D3N5_9SPHN|nr:hypothetical protein [Erythrobacter neustonensis]ANK12374.1 hypothetical protein A9D12_04775 [Erythrobacter neustonensis]
MRNVAAARYTRRMLLIAAVYVAGIVLASMVIDPGAPLGLLGIGLALIPGAAMLAAIGAIGRFVAELPDEYLRMLEVRKIIVATGVTLAITSVWGLLELYSDSLPRLPVFYVFPIWCAGLFVGQLVNRFAFGGDDTGGCP